jgi:hypothetical protein
VFVLMPRRNFLLVKQEKTTFYSKAWEHKIHSCENIGERSLSSVFKEMFGILVET